MSIGLKISSVFFPETLPPFRTMTADEEGNLYAVTFETGANQGKTGSMSSIRMAFSSAD
jgi:hypothetical protein